MPFEPEGEVALWRLAYELFVKQPDEAIVSHEELAERLGIDMAQQAERQRLWSAAGRARREVEGATRRRVTVVRGVGYRVWSPGSPSSSADSVAAALHEIAEAIEAVRFVVQPLLARKVAGDGQDDQG